MNLMGPQLFTHNCNVVSRKLVPDNTDWKPRTLKTRPVPNPNANTNTNPNPISLMVQGLFAPRYFRSLERKFPLGTFAPKNESSRELSLQGVKFPGYIRSAERYTG